jgi:rhamnosyltransferase
VSVVPTFRPPEELLALVDTLKMHGPVIISDDASPCTSDELLAAVARNDGVTVLRHSMNVGIGRGLNDGLRFAEAAHTTWLLTVDQDSAVTTDYVNRIRDTASELLQSGFPVGVVGAETVLDESGLMTYPSRNRGTLLATEELIQSGSLWSVDAMSSARGFDEALDNDAVDAAACLTLRERGYLVALAPELSFHHRIGSATQHRLLGRNVIVTHHSKVRKRAMLKNRLHLLPREARQSPRHAIRTIRRVLVNQTMGWLHKT